MYDAQRETQEKRARELKRERKFSKIGEFCSEIRHRVGDGEFAGEKNSEVQLNFQKYATEYVTASFAAGTQKSCTEKSAKN